MSVSSKLLDNAVTSFSSLPGIGKKTALRLVLHLINKDKSGVKNQFIEPLDNLIENIKFCSQCYNLSDSNLCGVCSNPHRNQNLICVVENIRDVLAIEETGHFSGVYHVLGGVISPLEGIGADDLTVDGLMARLDQNVEECIMAISPTIEGETTIFYLSKKINEKGVKVSQLARGISFGGELEYADGLTLGKSLLGRIPYTVQEY
ncbi:MAG: recombination mediator RecR [Saprospiraceae bacterium]